MAAAILFTRGFMMFCVNEHANRDFFIQSKNINIFVLNSFFNHRADCVCHNAENHERKHTGHNYPTGRRKGEHFNRSRGQNTPQQGKDLGSNKGKGPQHRKGTRV